MPHRHGHWISSPPPRLGSREETRREDGWEQLRSLFPTWFQPRTKLAGTHRTLGLISSTAAAAYPPISTNPARRHHTARQSCAWASWPCKPQLALPDHLDPTVADVMSSPPARRNLECDARCNRVQNPGYILSFFQRPLSSCPLPATPSSCPGHDTTAVGTMPGH